MRASSARARLGPLPPKLSRQQCDRLIQPPAIPEGDAGDFFIPLPDEDSDRAARDVDYFNSYQVQGDDNVGMLLKIYVGGDYVLTLVRTREIRTPSRRTPLQ